MPELSKLLRNLEDQVVRFQAWADAYPLAKRSGEMAVLHSLKALNSPLLDEYLIRAGEDGRQYLAGYVARLRAGAAE